METMTTVGYGHVVPENIVDRVIELILTGVAPIAIVTAVITALLVEQAKQRRSRANENAATRRCLRSA